jgi:hypothetical protein
MTQLNKVATAARGLLVIALVGLAGVGSGLAQDAPAAARLVEERLPAARMTRHELALEGRVLVFEANAGGLTLETGAGREEADIVGA